MMGFLEVLQDSFIRIWLNREKLQHIEHLRAYLKKIVLNECFTYLHKQALKNKRNVSIEQGEDNPDYSTEEHLSYNETRRIINGAIDALPPQRKTIYEMSRLKGMKSPEIAAELNLSASYVRKTISAAQQSIREHLENTGRFILTGVTLVIKIFFWRIGTVALFIRFSYIEWINSVSFI